MSESEKPQSNIISLWNIKNKKQALGRKGYLDLPARIRELEEDVLKLIDMSIILDNTVHHQERLINRLLYLLKERVMEEDDTPPSP